MPRESIHQESFTAGEFDSTLEAREDFDDYYQAVDRALNVFVQPTGGITRRDGLEYIDTIPTNTSYWKSNNQNDFAQINFASRENEKYMTILTHDGSNAVLKIYRDDSLVATKDGADASVKLPYSAGEISDIDWAQKLDVLYLLHEDYKPREVVRTNTDTFSVNIISFDHIPQYDFDDGNSPTEQNEVQRLSFSGMSGGDTYDLSLNGEVTANIVWDTSSSSNAQRIQNSLRRLPNTSPDGITVTHVSGDDYDVTFGGNDGSFDWDTLLPAIISGSGKVDVSVQTEGDSGEEDAWSNTRGWPKHGTFFNQRFWFGGSKELPETVWGSKIGEFFNFNLGDADPDDAIQGTINSDTVSEIRWIYGGRNLVFGTELVEHYVPKDSLTPADFRTVSTTRRGVKEIRPIESDGAIYYIQRGGQALREFVFSFNEDAYKSKNISLLASHLIKDPVAMSLRQSTQTDIADIIFMVNSEDGSAASLSLLRSEEVIAFTETQTKGNFRTTRSMDFDNYFIVERDIPEQSPTTDDWDEKLNLSFARRGMASAQNDGVLSIVGGKEGSTAVGTFLQYNFADDSYTVKSNLPSARFKGSAEYLEGRLYFGGGKNKNGNDSKQFWAQYRDANAWEELQKMPVNTSSHELIESNDRLFLIDPSGTWEYKPNRDEWQSLTRMPNIRSDFAVASHDKKVYVFGGEDTNGDVTATVQIYDIENDSWSTGTDMSQKRRNASAEVAVKSTGNEIWVIGGYSGASYLKTNEAYSITNDTWTSQNTMTTKRSLAASGINKLKMHVIGGTNGSDVKKNERYGHLQPVHQLEKLNEDHLLDTSIIKKSGLGGKTISGFGHLQGETVDVHADGFYRGEFTVDSNGEVTLDEVANDYVEVGYDLIEPTIRLMKPTLEGGQTTVTNRKKRIVEADIQLLETQGLAVNGNRLSFRRFGDDILDQRIPVFTGMKTVDGITGWDDEIFLEITQPDPQPMTLLGVIQTVTF